MPDARDTFLAAQRRMLHRYGVDARARFVPIASTRGHAQVLEWGSGAPVILLNGIGTPGAMWAPLMAELEGLHLFAVDLPGYGLSDAPPDLSNPLRDNAVRFLTDVLDQLELERPAVVANSLGSLWACWLAMAHPRRVAQLVHVGCPALCAGTSAPLPMRLLSIRPLGRLLTSLQPPSYRQVEQLSRMVHQYPLTPELTDLLLATERLPHYRATFLSMVHTLLRLRGPRPEMALTEEQLASLTQPTLFLWGDDDPFGQPEAGRQAVAAMHEAEFRLVRGGHCPWLNEPHRVAHLAREFLASSA